ncbi:hypothetical protein VM1G_10969 [Cytospora mali]|uniref:Uncharacterized protein n=1 Tax=Cytospora mali TaxID=578113 RepID=A0A194VJN3_CYTMA|nr:hypothetical protein VM1G_10969 [Valsa mali]
MTITTTTMAPNQHRHHTLRTNLPRAGFNWPDRRSVLMHERRDRAILAVLRDREGATSLRRGARDGLRHVQHQIGHILAGMFDMAAAEAEAGRIDSFETPLDWVVNLRTRLRWAGHLGEDIFLELFLQLSRARRKWHKHPREPFNTEEHGVLAHAIDGFHQIASDDWAKSYEWLFFNTVFGERSSGEPVGDDPAAAAPHTQETGASVAAGEPHPDTPLASGGAEDEDSDVHMGDGDGEEEEEEEEEEDSGVQEVRQCLADTKLGQEMEVEE